MKKFIKRIKSNAGVSLTELIIGMALLSIFVLTIGALLTNVTRLQNRVIEMTELNALIDNISNPVVREVSNATHAIAFCTLESCDNTSCAGDGINRFTVVIGGIGSVVYSIDDEGALFRSCDSPQCDILDCPGHQVLHKDSYKFRSVNFTLAPATIGTGTAYILTITLTCDRNNDSILSTREYAIRPFAPNLS
ncbi:MAG: hypothetical protein LBC86_09260 [Oscillospiraceae bacterium]|jgi:hypothetical protein|nr:hypothetical protein [Oscillospiraceae bacterium]